MTRTGETSTISMWVGGGGKVGNEKRDRNNYKESDEEEEGK